MPPRRSHRKSHNGCLQCKRRHVKCDEQRPTCSQCTKREIACHFVALSSSDIDPQRPSSFLPNHQQDCAHGPDRLSVGPSRSLELKLVQHFITETYKSLYPNGPSDVQCWQNQVPDMAFYGESENPFLLDSLLAVSALHLAHLESVSANITGAKKSWLQTALRYQDLALAGLNKALSSISSENCEAVAVSAIFVLLLSIAIPGVCNDDDDGGGGVGGVGEQGMARSPLTDLMGLRKLLQGMELVYAQSEVVLMNGVLKDFFLPMFDPNAVAPRAVMKGVEETAFAEGQKLCPQILKSLARLRTAISLRTDDTHLSSLQAACSMLSDIISPLTTLSHGPAITWPQRIDASIFSLLEKNDPLSCLLFLHYGVVLHIFSYWWFTRNAGRRLVRALLPYWKGVSGHGNGDGDREWRECVEWAKMVVGVVG